MARAPGPSVLRRRQWAWLRRHRMLIALAGLAGTGKSTIARHLARLLPAVVLDKDVVRAALFAPELVEYSTEQDDFCLSLMLQTAAYLLRRDSTRHVILDGRTFSRRYQIETVVQEAAALRVPLRVIECVCSEETARLRLARDLATGVHPAANRDYALYREVKARAEPLTVSRLVVDTDDDLASCVDACVRYLGAPL